VSNHLRIVKRLYNPNFLKL